MVLVQTIDRMASNLSPLLLGGKDHVQINSSNISTSLHILLLFYIYNQASYYYIYYYLRVCDQQRICV